jgi:hypothetical protein
VSGTRNRIPGATVSDAKQQGTKIDTYETPELTVHGELQSLTQSVGNRARKDNGSTSNRSRSL